MDTPIFTVQPDDLKRLGPKEAIRFLSELLWAEARRAGLPVTAISISSRTDVPDGGVDARVLSHLAITTGLLVNGDTVFQVKTGDFKPVQAAAVHNELFGHGKTASKDSLSDHLRECMDAGHRYVLVCTGIDLADEERSTAVDGMRKAFVSAGYADPSVDVLSQNQLIGCLVPFPSLCLVLNGHAGAQFQSTKSWGDNDQMRTAFKAGDAQERAVETLRAGLRATSSAVHIRVRGEPGVGKTRLVLEAVSLGDLAPLVVYCDNPQTLRDGGLLNEILKESNPFELLLVVDECNLDAAVVLWDRLKNKGPRIRLVTIYNEHDTLNVPYVDAPPLDEVAIAKILQEYIPATERADRWAEFCGGSPRVAHVIGNNLKNNPDDLLKSPDTVNLWGRYIAGSDDAASVGVQQRHRVLRHLALFKRFGYGGPLVGESKIVAKRIEEADPSITWGRFQEIVEDLKARRILQGEHTLYITPRLLHIKLWTEWWDTHGTGFDLSAFATGLSPELIDWFYEMFRYAAESKAASAFVKSLLGAEGPFEDGEFLKSEQGSSFFQALTDASPESALRRLKATVGTWSREQLLAFKTGRRGVIWALERIAVWRDLFPDSSRLMLQLAEAENETWANNATGLFADFFSPGYGAVAPTEAPPDERFPVLKEALTSASKERRLVALLACDHALQTSMFTRMVGAERQGLRRSPVLWTPKTWGELFDAYRRVWLLLAELLDEMEPEEQAKAVDVLLNNARGLYYTENLSEMVIGTIKGLTSKQYVDRKKIIELVEDVLHHDAKGFTPEQRAPWDALRESVIGNDFASRMQRYVAMELIEDRFDDNNQHVDKVGPKISELAGEAISNPDLLWPELPWLMSDGAKNGYHFGFELGTRDVGLSSLPRLIDEQRAHANVFFFAGYLRALFDRNVSAWEAQLDSLAEDPTLRVHIPELTWRGGMTDQAARRVLKLAENGLVEPTAFRMFAFGGVIRNLSPDVFHDWIEFLLRTDRRDAADAALDLYHFYYAFKDAPAVLPEDLTFRLLTAPPLFDADRSSPREANVDYDWKRIAEAFIEQYPARLVPLASVMLEHFGKDNTIIGRFHSPTLEILSTALRNHPTELWEEIAGYLGPPIDSRAFAIKHWLREGPLAHIPAEAIFKWIGADPEKRAWYVATFVPSTFPGDPSSLSARELLVRYGAREDVRRNLAANCSSEFWTGPQSRHFESKLKWLRDVRLGETDANVLKWLDEYIARVEQGVERAKIEEERDGF